MFLCPFGLYRTACFGILFVSILCTCCSHFFWYCFISSTVFCAPVFSLIHWFFTLSNFVIPSKCLKNFICAASKRCSSLFFSIQASLPNFNAALAVMLWILNFVSLFICFPKLYRQYRHSHSELMGGTSQWAVVVKRSARYHKKLLKWLLTYILTPQSRVLLEKLTSLQLVRKFPAFYETWRFITAFTSACHLSLSWASSFQSIPQHPTCWRSILILSSHLCLVSPRVSFLQVSPPKPHTRLSPPAYVLHAPPISLFLILSPKQYWMRSTYH